MTVSLEGEIETTSDLDGEIRRVAYVDFELEPDYPELVIIGKERVE
jgi:hypothetical protein